MGQENCFLKKNNIFLGFVLLLFFHFIFVFCSFYFNDDINYSRYAADIIHHGFFFEPSNSNSFQLRWTQIFVTALSYKLFGINVFSSTICSFISIILSGILLKKNVEGYKLPNYFLALVLYFFAHSILFYIHRVLPDAPMCFAVFWLYSSYRSYTIKQNNPLIYAFQFAAAFLLSIVTKETIIIVVPLFIVLLLNDILKRKLMFFWKYATISTLILVGIYLVYFKLTTGSFFYRYYLLQKDSYLNGCSFNLLPLSFTINRIVYQLWQAMLLNGDQLVLLPAVAAFIYRKKLVDYENIKNVDFYAFIILLISSNFMTISFTSYVPLCQDPRHFLFLFPFAAIIAAPMISAYCKSPSQFLLLPIFLLLATLCMFYQHTGLTKYFYLLFCLILLARLAFKGITDDSNIPNLFMVFICTLFFCNYIIDFMKPLYPYYWNHKKIVEKAFAGKNLKATIFTADEFSAEMTEYFFGFNKVDLKIKPIDSAKTINQGDLYYLIVSKLNPTAQTKLDSLRNTNLASKFTLIDKEKEVSLYKIDDATLHLLK